VLDFRRKFIEAAVRYNELSYKTVVAEDERMTALRNALICTVLASAGMDKLRLLVFSVLSIFSPNQKTVYFEDTMYGNIAQ